MVPDGGSRPLAGSKPLDYARSTSPCTAQTCVVSYSDIVDSRGPKPKNMEGSKTSGGPKPSRVELTYCQAPAMVR